MTVTNKKAYDALLRARTVLLITQPFFGSLALQLEVVEKPDSGWWQGTPTMAVDGYCMYYHPDFTLSLSEDELKGVVAHEVMHCCYKHMTRRGHRHPVIWNYAGDFVINADLLKTGFVLPKQRLHDPKYDGMSTEEVYERLKQECQQETEGGGGGKGKKKGQVSGLSEDGDMDAGNCGGVLDAGSPNDQAKADKVSRDWETKVRQAVNVARAANAGSLPGYLEQLVKQMKQPKVSWRDITRQFIDGNMHKDFSWARPHRRYAGQGLILPGFIPDALHHLIMVADVSGSVSDDLLISMVSEVGGALDEGTADRLSLLYVDTEIKRVDEYVPGDFVQATIMRGGGTNFTPAFNWVNENAQDASCMIYLTDMMPYTWKLPEVNCPVLWAAYCPESFLRSLTPPFGSVVHVDSGD